ncbi:MAG: SAM-dependent methyltransferase [Mariprofundales bacterium]
MQSALYEPSLGYYEKQQVFGKQGDFVTGATLGPWLALGFVDLLIHYHTMRQQQDQDWCLIEQGGGDGSLLLKLLPLLAKEVDAHAGNMPRVYAIECSEQMRQRQRVCYAKHGLAVEVLSSIEALPIQQYAVLICNELLDAMPVRCFRKNTASEQWLERGIVWQNNAFVWQDKPLAVSDIPQIDNKIITQWPNNYCSEWNPNLEDIQKSWRSRISNGTFCCVDYGYKQSEYYRAGRVEGSLMAHQEHRITDVLGNPGSRDITAHIDFTALAQAGKKHGWHSQVFMSQGGWLAQSPLVQQCVQEMAEFPNKYVSEIAAAKRMLLPFGMGELFKLYIASTDAEQAIPAWLQSFNKVSQLQ